MTSGGFLPAQGEEPNELGMRSMDKAVRHMAIHMQSLHGRSLPTADRRSLITSVGEGEWSKALQKVVRHFANQASQPTAPAGSQWSDLVLENEEMRKAIDELVSENKRLSEQVWSLLGTSRHDDSAAHGALRGASEDILQLEEDGESSESEGSELFCPIVDDKKHASRAVLQEEVVRLENRVRAYQVELKLLNVLRLQKDELAAENVLLKMRIEYLGGELRKFHVPRSRVAGGREEEQVEAGSRQQVRELEDGTWNHIGKASQPAVQELLGESIAALPVQFQRGQGAVLETSATESAHGGGEEKSRIQGIIVENQNLQLTIDKLRQETLGWQQRCNNLEQEMVTISIDKERLKLDVAELSKTMLLKDAKLFEQRVELEKLRVERVASSRFEAARQQDLQPNFSSYRPFYPPEPERPQGAQVFERQGEQQQRYGAPDAERNARKPADDFELFDPQMERKGRPSEEEGESRRKAEGRDAVEPLVTQEMMV
uniref:Uncharacterized protein n=1 Tax=Hanusia phi TaxID=3032 RepID=A0A7S0F3J2_9CRYP|mmetsp:Transcript_36184/g.81457  ORF Transcript_36184/g.81457 Transcript_36184/m.81457 type:complete len:488 (+) Transcript_36184:2079-3542(+)